MRYLLDTAWCHLLFTLQECVGSVPPQLFLMVVTERLGKPEMLSNKALGPENMFLISLDP